MKPAYKRELANFLIDAYRVSIRRATAVVQLRQGTYFYRPYPRVQVDNGSEFISVALDQWAYEQGVTLDFSRPGKPMDNAFIESFNDSLRQVKIFIYSTPRYFDPAVNASLALNVMKLVKLFLPDSF